MPGEYSVQDLMVRFAAINERFQRIEDHFALLSKLLGVPALPPASAEVPPDVVKLARAGKTLEAVKRYREATGVDFDTARKVILQI